MSSRLFVSTVLSVALGFGACDGDPAGGSGASERATATGPVGELAPNIREEIGETVATVDGMPIGLNEFLQLAGRKLRGSEGGSLSSDDRQAVIDELVEQKVLYLEARERGLDYDPRVQRLMVQLLLQDQVYGDIKSADLSDDELRDYFERNREDFIIPEKIRLRRIFIKGDPTRTADEAKELATSIYQRVAAEPESFQKIAAEVSEGPYRGRGGDLGLVGREPRPGVPQEVIDKGFLQPIGGVSEPFEAAGGWNIVFTADRRERLERTFAQMRGAVVRRAKAEKHQEAYEAYVAERQSDATVEVFSDKLDSVRLAGAKNERPPEEASDPSDETDGAGDEGSE